MITRFALSALAVVLLGLPSLARADDCACAVAACTAMATSQHRPTTSCAKSASQPAQCTMLATSLLRAMKMMSVAAPKECAALASSSSGSGAGSGGGGGGTGSTPPPPAPAPDAPKDSPPKALPPDPTTPTSGGAGLACVMQRTGGKRVMVAGGTASFAVKCAGIPVPGNSGGGLAVPPVTTNDGTAVQITWSAATGTVHGSGASATWTLPTTAPNPADAQVKAVVRVGRDSVTVFGTVHIVNKHLTLEFTGHTVNKCTPLSQGKGTLNVGFDLLCTMTMDLAVANDLSVKGTGGRSCGTGMVTDAQLCAPQLEDSWEAVPGWSFDSATGTIDDVSGIMDLGVTGNRIGLVRVHFKGGKTNDVHTNALFSRGFQISTDDGSFRSFGSLTTTPQAGSTNAFSIHSP